MAKTGTEIRIRILTALKTKIEMLNLITVIMEKLSVITVIGLGIWHTKLPERLSASFAGEHYRRATCGYDIIN